MESCKAVLLQQHHQGDEEHTPVNGRNSKLGAEIRIWVPALMWEWNEMELKEKVPIITCHKSQMGGQISDNWQALLCTSVKL